MKEQIFSEAIRLEGGNLYNLSYHEARMRRTMEHFYGKSQPLFVEIPEDKRKGLYKCRLVYSDRVHSIEFIPYIYPVVRNISVVKDNSVCYAHKYTDRDCLNTLLRGSECDDIIIIKNDFVTDASSSNLVFEDKNGLYTPDTYLLRGTKRESLLAGGIIRERPIGEKDIRGYDYVYLINAMIDLEDGIKIPVTQLSAKKE
jgi:4-amino-4-deoxychorismate lyase